MTANACVVTSAPSLTHLQGALARVLGSALALARPTGPGSMSAMTANACVVTSAPSLTHLQGALARVLGSARACTVPPALRVM